MKMIWGEQIRQPTLLWNGKAQLDAIKTAQTLHINRSLCKHTYTVLYSEYYVSILLSVTTSLLGGLAASTMILLLVLVQLLLFHNTTNYDKVNLFFLVSWQKHLWTANYEEFNITLRAIALTVTFCGVSHHLLWISEPATI